jgi:hypothetical protein
METKEVKCLNGECDGNCCNVVGCCEERGRCPEHDVTAGTMDIETMAWWDANSRGDEERKSKLEDGI